MSAAEPATEQAAANAQWARMLVDELVRGGVAHVALSPGSRSTPLALAIAERAGVVGGIGGAKVRGRDDIPAAAHPDLALTVHIDERSAAFFALGRSRASGRPSALVCTSGSAGAHYLPALIEAHHSRVPLLVLTADRPAELRESGAWQTIDQTGLFRDFVRWFFDLPAPDPADLDGGLRTRTVRLIAARAVAVALTSPAGPVHLNVPFREPLVPVARLDEGMSSITSSAAEASPRSPVEFHPHNVFRGRPGGASWTVSAATVRTPTAAIIDALAARCTAHARGLILAGTTVAPLRHGDAWSDAVHGLSKALGWPILAEATSGLRFGPNALIPPITGYASALRHAPVRHDPGNAPDAVLRLGASHVWKHVAQFVDEAAPELHIVLDPEGTWDDPTRSATLRLQSDALPTIRMLAERVAALPAPSRSRSQANEAWRERWAALDRAVAMERALACAETTSGSGKMDDAAPSVAPFYPALLANLPAGTLIWAANSMAVRDLDTFSAADPRRLYALASRGAAGIDGTISTALGAAAGHPGPACLITGDLAFLHDLNGVGVLDGRGGPLTGVDLLAVVFDDRGGGIFEHLPVARGDRGAFENLFATPPTLGPATACRMVGLAHAVVTSPEDLAIHAARWRATGGLRVLVVPIDRAANTQAHRRHWARVATALDRPTAPTARDGGDTPAVDPSDLRGTTGALGDPDAARDGGERRAIDAAGTADVPGAFDAPNCFDAHNGVEDESG